MSGLAVLARRPSVWLFIIAIFALVFIAPSPAAAASCATSGPSGGAYTATVCITAPAAGATVNGNNTTTATVSVTGTNPGVQRVIFNLDGAYLITDFQSTYTFTLPTARFVDGMHTLQAQALMRDAFTTAQASISLNFSNGVTSPPTNTNSFTPGFTNPPAGQPLVVAAAGDGAGGETNAGSVVSLIKTWNPNLMLYLGDVYEKGSPVEFMNWYDPSGFYGAFRSITDPTIGNHEYEQGVAPGYFDYWNNVPNYYSFNAGGWHFISLNSNSQLNQYNPGTPQYQWLQQDLAANAGACTIAYFHHPVYSIGPQGDTPSMDPIWSLLYSAHATLVLTGHDHDYQRWVPLDGAGNPASDGITQIVVGTGGHGISGFVRTDSRLAVGSGTTSSYGALRLQLSSTSANFAFVNKAGSTIDSGTVPCQGIAPAPTSTPTPAPTNTPVPPTPTNTPVPATATNTPIPPTPTNTPAANPTNTPLPATPTNTPVPPTATNTALPPTPTNTPPPATATNTPLPPTATSTPLPPTATNTPPPPTATSTPLPATPTSTPTRATVTTTVNPVADSYVDSSNPAANFGTSTQIRVDGSPIVNSYLRFSVSGLSGTVKQVQLQIYANSSLSTGVTASRVADNTWGETTITYSNAPAIGSAIGTSSAVSTGTWITIDVTSYVTGNGTYSLAITSTNATALSMASREATNKPKLVITTQ